MSARISILSVVCLVTAVVMLSSTAQGQLATKNGIEVASIDTETRWGFRTLSPVTISTPIVRLGDVVVPLDPNMAGWQRLRGAAVGLVPLDGHPMTIERSRLNVVVQAAEATPQVFDWVGPTKIVVNYHPDAARLRTSINSPSRPVASHSAVRPATYLTPAAPSASPLTPSEQRRVVQWVERGIASFLPEVLEDFSIEIEPNQPGLANLKSLAVVTSVELLEPIREGDVACRVAARGVSGPIEAQFALTLLPHPMIVVPRSSLQRGHRIGAEDLQLQQIKRDQMRDEYLTEVSQAIGKEVKTSLAANRPIQRDRLGTPILVRRGDLVEVQVVGGGITVSTNAKAMGDGSASDLIEVETLQPRKRLVGRVVTSGLVEIVTRAPSIQR